MHCSGIFLLFGIFILVQIKPLIVESFMRYDEASLASAETSDSDSRPVNPALKNDIFGPIFAHISAPLRAELYAIQAGARNCTTDKQIMAALFKDYHSFRRPSEQGVLVSIEMWI